MEIVERILAKIVGHDMTPEELVEVTGGRAPNPVCPAGQMLTTSGCVDI